MPSCGERSRTVRMSSWLVATVLVLAGCTTSGPPLSAKHEPVTPDDVIVSVDGTSAYQADLISAVARPITDDVPVAPSMSGMSDERTPEPAADASAYAFVDVDESGKSATVFVHALPSGEERARLAFNGHLPAGKLMLQWSPTSQWLYVSQDDEHVLAFDSRDPQRTARVINIPAAMSAFVVPRSSL